MTALPWVVALLACIVAWVALNNAANANNKRLKLQQELRGRILKEGN